MVKEVAELALDSMRSSADSGVLLPETRRSLAAGSTSGLQPEFHRKCLSIRKLVTITVRAWHAGHTCGITICYNDFMPKATFNTWGARMERNIQIPLPAFQYRVCATPVGGLGGGAVQLRCEPGAHDATVAQAPALLIAVLSPGVVRAHRQRVVAPARHLAHRKMAAVSFNMWTFPSQRDQTQDACSLIFFRSHACPNIDSSVAHWLPCPDTPVVKPSTGRSHAAFFRRCTCAW